MKFSKSDFPLMRWNMLALAASVILSSVILYASGEYVGKAQNDQRGARNMENDARRRLAAARDDKENMSIYAEEYGALVKNNIIGDDQRLDWIEGLEKLRQLNLVTDFSYSINPQSSYTPQPPLDSGNFDIRYSETKLQFDLLHEAQLVDFFTALRKNIKGWYHLEGCTLQRSSPTGDDSAKLTATQLKAECSGGWITLKNRNAQP